MSASLVGSEMCIRDRASPLRRNCASGWGGLFWQWCPAGRQPHCFAPRCACLLYTSDAADDM
eukprot:8727856-Alexandrium_andersonii.AAC.1